MPTIYEIIMHILGLLIGWSLTSMYYLKKYDLLQRRYDRIEKSRNRLLDEYKKALKEKR
jgi:uncharacterized membrane protein YciS (DUF1049 family)